jgi:hypothetical protein
MSKSTTIKTQKENYIRFVAQLEKSDYTFSDLLEKTQRAKNAEKAKNIALRDEYLAEINQILKPKRNFSSISSIEGSLRRYNLVEREAINNNPNFDMVDIKAKIEKRKLRISFSGLTKRDIRIQQELDEENDEADRERERERAYEEEKQRRSNNWFNTLFEVENIKFSSTMIRTYGIEEIYGLKKKIEGKNNCHIGFNADLGSSIPEIIENLDKINRIIRILSNYFDVDYINPISQERISHPYIAFTIAYYPIDENGMRLSELQLMRMPFSDSFNFAELIRVLSNMSKEKPNEFGFDFHPSPKVDELTDTVESEEFWEFVCIRPMIACRTRYFNSESGFRKGLFFNFVNRKEQK